MFQIIIFLNCIFSFFEILIFRGDNHHTIFWKNTFHLIQASPFDLQSWNLPCMIEKSIPRKVFFIFWKFKFLWEIIDNVVFIFLLQFNIHQLTPTIFYLQRWNLICMIPKSKSQETFFIFYEILNLRGDNWYAIFFLSLLVTPPYFNLHSLKSVCMIPMLIT